MKCKNVKNEKNEKGKLNYFLFGLTLAITFSIVIINWNFKIKNYSEFSEIDTDLPYNHIEESPIYNVILKSPKPKPPVKRPKITIVVPKTSVNVVSTKPILTIEDIDIDDLPPVEETVDIEEVLPLDYQLVEKAPHFSNCTSSDNKSLIRCLETGIFDHIKENFKYPKQEKQLKIEDKVLINFVFSKNGYVKDLKVLRGKNKNLIREAKRLIKSIPKVIPGKQRGNFVDVSFTIPIQFSLKQ